MKTKYTIYVLALLMTSGIAYCDDLCPPCLWQRGEDGSTYQRWEYYTDNSTPFPDECDNPYGVATTAIYPMGNWQECWGGRNGVWPLSGLIISEIPNAPETNNHKWFQVQLTWAGEVGNPQAVPCLFLNAETAAGEPIPLESIILLNTTDCILEETGVSGAGEYWHHTTYLYEMRPNPIVETLSVGSGIMVDELIVDTICMPEPASMVLLGVGGIAIAWVRKRKRK